MTARRSVSSLITFPVLHGVKGTIPGFSWPSTFAKSCASCRPSPDNSNRKMNHTIGKATQTRPEQYSEKTYRQRVLKGWGKVHTTLFYCTDVASYVRLNAKIKSPSGFTAVLQKLTEHCSNQIINRHGAKAEVENIRHTRPSETQNKRNTREKHWASNACMLLKR